MAWNDVNNNKNGGNDKVEYVKFPEGATKLRIIDAEPESRWTHWIPQANGGKGLSVKCIGKECPICAAIKADKTVGKQSKYNATKNHAINVINRNENNQIQILDKGNQIFNQLKVLMGQMGDLRNYDVTITRTGSGKGNTSYMVTPVYPPTPLTKEEQDKANNERMDLQEITKGFDKEQIIALMGGAKLEDIVGDKKDKELTEVNDDVMPDFTA